MSQCAVLPSDINQSLNRLRQAYHKEGYPKDKAMNMAIDALIDIVEPTNYGSSRDPIDGIAGRSYDAIQGEEILNLFDEIVETTEDLDPDHTSYLRNLISNLADPLRRAGNKSVQIMFDNGITRGEIEGNDITINIETDPSLTPLALSAAEVYSHELVHNVTSSALEARENAVLTKEVLRLWKEVRDGLNAKYKGKGYKAFLAKDESGKPITKVNARDEIAAAKERFDYIFGSTSVSNGRSVALHEFVAFGKTNKAFRDELKSIKFSPVKKTRPKNLEGWLSEIFNRISDWYTNLFTETRHKSSQAALDKLVVKLTKVQDKHKYSSAGMMKLINKGNVKLQRIIDKKVWEPLENWSAEKTRRRIQTGNYNVSFGEAALGVLNYRTHDEYVKHLSRFKRISAFNGRSAIYTLIREIGGRYDDERWIERKIYESTASIDKESEDVVAAVKSHLLGGFTTKVKKSELNALTRTLLKLDLSSLLDKYSINDIIEFLTDSNKLSAEIDAISNSFRGPQASRNWLINNARNTGHFIAQGTALYEGNTLLNAHSIVTGHGLVNREQIGDLSAYSADVNRLISLFGIVYTDQDNLDISARVMRREQTESKDDNGISMLLAVHKLFKEDSLEKNFDNNQTQTTKGYIKDVLDPRIGIKIVDANDTQTIRELRDNGYKRVKVLKADPDNTGTVKHLYASSTAGLDTRVKTAFSIANKASKGTSIMEDNNRTYLQNFNNLQEVKRKKALKSQGMLSSNPTIANTNTLIPTLDDRGNISDYRYMMEHSFKEDFFKQNMDATEVLARMMGSVVYKTNSTKMNKELIRTLKEDYDNNYQNDPRNYVFINSNVTDPELAEIYKLIPEDIKFYAKQTFGIDEIPIREEWVRPIFGFRKLSIANNKYVNTKVGRIIEEIVKSLVKLAKSNIVIKSMHVLRDNIISNTVLLMLKDVPIELAFKYQLEGVRHLDTYLNDEKKIRDLELQQVTKGVTKARTSEIAALESQLLNNPVRPLMEANLFQSITEDVEGIGDKYSMIGDFKNAIKPYSDSVPVVRDIYKHAYMTEDTPMFKLLLKGTQYSDFVSRYAFYQNKVVEGEIDPNAAINELTDMFINYEWPNHPLVQYANDLGLVLFTRYPMRIMKTIFSLFQKNPANVMLLIMLENLLGKDIPTVMDSTVSWNPLTPFDAPANITDAASDFHGLGIQLLK